MIKYKDIAWLAGILEGEGSFFIDNQKRKLANGDYKTYPTPTLQVNMSDEDVIARVSQIVDKNYTVIDWHHRQNPEHKIQYRVKLTGEKALIVMRNIYEFMGERRQQKFCDIAGICGSNMLLCSNERMWDDPTN